MRIALITDIHANYIALQAVTDHVQKWGADIVIVGGDIVNRGPRPSDCLQFVLEKQASCGWLFIRGNHEDYVIQQSKPDAPKKGPAAEVHRASIWTFEQLNYRVDDLEAMPFKQELIDPDGNLIRFVHGSMLGKRDGIYPETSDDNLHEKIRSTDNEETNLPVVFGVGHTHRPIIRKLNNTLIVNAGSAGLPFDGELRPSYAQLTWQKGTWHAKIVRLDYDIQAAIRDFDLTGYLKNGGPLVELVLIELKTASSQLYYWSNKYQDDATAGRITMRDSVNEHISSLQIRSGQQERI